MVLDMVSKKPYMILDMVSKIRQNILKLQILFMHFRFP